MTEPMTSVLPNGVIITTRQDTFFSEINEETMAQWHRVSVRQALRFGRAAGTIEPRPW